MASREQLLQALDKADAAGATDDARDIAAMIRQMDVQSPRAPAEGRPGGQAQPEVIDLENSPDRSGAGLEAFGAHALDAATLGVDRPVIAFLRSIATGRPYKEERANQQAYMEGLQRESPLSAGAGSLVGAVGAGGVAGLGLRAGARAAEAAGQQVLARGLSAAGDLYGTVAGPDAGLKRKALAIGTAGAVGGAVQNAGEQAVQQAEGALTDYDPTQGRGFSVGNVAQAAGYGAATGVGAGAAIKSAGWAANKVPQEWIGGPWRLLAKKLGITPQQMAEFQEDVRGATGRAPNLPLLMSARQQGVFRDLGASKPSAGEAFADAARAGERALPEEARSAIREELGAVPRTADELSAATARPADEFMSAQVQRPGRQSDFNSPTVAQETVPVTLSRRDAALLNDPNARDLMRALPPELRSRINGAADDLANANVAGTRRLSLRDLDDARRLMRDEAERRGWSGVAHDLNDRWATIGDRAAPGYRENVLTQYERGALREEGATAGRGLSEAPMSRTRPAVAEGLPERQAAMLEGRGEGAARRAYDAADRAPRRALDELAGSQDMQGALSAAYGAEAAGRLSARAERLRSGQQALDEIAPRRITPEDDTGAEAGAAAARGVLKAVTGHKLGAVHEAGRVVANAFGGGISDRAAGRIAAMLVSRDPAVVAQGVKNLRRAGLANAAIGRLQASLAKGAAYRAGAEKDEPLRIDVRPNRDGR